MPPELRSEGRFTDALRRGLCPFDLPTRSKVPNTLWTRFRDTPMTLDQAARLDGTDRNVGIITGSPSNAFVLDLDGLRWSRLPGQVCGKIKLKPVSSCREFGHQIMGGMPPMI
jgi:hypothetical protein